MATVSAADDRQDFHHRNAAPATGAQFIDTIGVNTHLSWIDTTYWDMTTVTGALAYLGVDNVRDVITPLVGRADRPIGPGGDRLLLHRRDP